jgi:hypothetical protein
MVAYAKTKPRWQSIHSENEHLAAMAAKHPPTKDQATTAATVAELVNFDV